MPLALLLLGQAAPDLIEAARTRTAAEVRCAAADTAAITADVTADVTVCGRRAADRFRVPLATHVADRHDDVPADRAALLHCMNPVQELSPFLVGGGMAGVTVGTSFGASGGETRVRPLAP